MHFDNSLYKCLADHRRAGRAVQCSSAESGHFSFFFAAFTNEDPADVPMQASVMKRAVQVKLACSMVGRCRAAAAARIAARIAARKTVSEQLTIINAVHAGILSAGRRMHTRLGRVLTRGRAHGNRAYLIAHRARRVAGTRYPARCRGRAITGGIYRLVRQGLSGGRGGSRDWVSVKSRRRFMLETRR